MIPYHKPYPLTVDFSDIFESGIYTNDKYCRELEDKIGRMYNCNALACSSGTQGLLLAIYLRYSNEIISISAFNWFSDKYILELLNKEIIYRDIDRSTWLTEAYPTSIRLHTFGNIDPYVGFNVIDGTHALGSKIKDLGSATIISLAPTKLVSSGEGGIILTEKDLPFLKCNIDKLRELRNRCSRMSEFHAKIGLEYLKHLDKFLAWKKRVFEYYKANIDGQFQEIPYDSNFNTIGFLNINKLKIPENIDFRQYYEPLYKGLKNTEFVYENIVCLPSWYNVDYKLIVDLINDANKI